MSQKYTAPTYDKDYAVGEYPDLPPPTNNQGVWGWLRENLFTNWKNTIITFLLVIWLGHIIPSVANWTVLNASNNGQTSQQCLIAQRVSTFDQDEVASSMMRRILITPSTDRVAGDNNSYWTTSGGFSSTKRFIASIFLFQSPSIDQVLNADVMQYDEVDKYLREQSNLLSSITRNIEDIQTDQAKEFANAESLFSQPLETLAADPQQTADDPRLMSQLFNSLDDQLKQIDIRRVFDDISDNVDYEAVREFQPYRFYDERNAEDYAAAKIFYLENIDQLRTAMKASEAKVMSRAEEYLEPEDKAVLTSVNMEEVKTNWDAASENGDPVALRAAMSQLDPMMNWANNNNGACWTYPQERWWKAFTFGAYPEFQKWRPIMAFVWLILALLPALAPPFKGRNAMWIFTATMPFAIYILLTGDSIVERFVQNGVDGSVSISTRIMMGIFLLGFAMLPTMKAEEYSKAFWAFWWALVGALGLWIVSGDAITKPLFENLFENPSSFDLLENTQEFKLWGGIMLNILLGVTGILLSLPIGVALALGRRSSLPIIGYICTFLIEIIRGVPLITILFMGALVFPYFVPPSWNIDALPRMIIAVTMFSAAYMAEVIRGGLQGLDKGQYEGAAALGLNYWKAHRLIILPQALKIVIPGIVNTFIGLFKDTTLVSIVAVGLFEILGTNNNHLKGNADWRAVENEGYVIVALFFFICCFLMARYSIWLEKRLDTGHRS